jgi:hypothetical protein
MNSHTSTEEIWPPLPFGEWQDSCETLHMWMEIIGKVKLALCPFLNEWWEVSFFVSARGLTTSIIPYGDGVFEINVDFIDHDLIIQTSGGASKQLPLRPQSVADFHAEFMAALNELGIRVAISMLPSEVANPIRFDQDRTHASYDATYAHRWWQILVQTDKVLQRFRSPFVGKASPIQFFWGTFDLSETRFSGRPASPPPGSDIIYRLSEDQENYACGFWPGNGGFGEAAFYAYVYPPPDGIASASIRPDAAFWDGKLGEFVLKYEDLRQASSPEEMLLDFFQTTYEAGASLAHWDRDLLERHPTK